MAKVFGKIKSGVKEAWRKILVSLKRNPQYIPMAMLLISFLVYSLNLTHISNTTAKIYGDNMGFYAFLSMLLSILSFVCMIGAYPKRQKPKVLMILLMLVMYCIVIYADFNYYLGIQYAVTREVNRIEINENTIYISKTYTVMALHMFLMVLTMISVVLEPLFAKILKKINTSVDVEDNGKIDNIELTED